MDLFEAIEAEDEAQVRAILAADPTLAGRRGPDGVSAVLTAQYRMRPGLVEAVLEAGAELDVFDAAALGRIDRLTEIIDAEPDAVNAWATDGFNPLGLAAFFGHPDAVALLLARGADVGAVSRNAMQVQAIHAATAAHSAEAVTLLLEAGADADARQHGGWTPLSAARHAGDEVIAGILVAHGARDEGPGPYVPT